MTVDEVFDAIVSLSPERALLRERLEYVDPTLPEVPGEDLDEEEYRRAWRVELARRLEALDRGEVETDTWENVQRRLRNELASDR